MLRVTFFNHCGALVELDEAYLLFDYWRGHIPPLSPEKPLLILTCGRHQEHFHPNIFKMPSLTPNYEYFLGEGLTLNPKYYDSWGVTPEILDKCRLVHGGDVISLPCGVTIDVLSTGGNLGVGNDLGDAFLVKTAQQTVYCAGDLSWWCWDRGTGASEEEILAEKAPIFKPLVECLRGMRIDLALLPVDPMQFLGITAGARYYLELADIRHVLPVHGWGDFTMSDLLRRDCPEYADAVLSVTHENQFFDLS